MPTRRLLRKTALTFPMAATLVFFLTTACRPAPTAAPTVTARPVV